MKLYIWEGKGISAGYHDDGTLVVLAESPEQARQIAIASAPQKNAAFWENRENIALLDRTDIWQDGYETYVHSGDRNEAIDREPDRIVDLDVPRVVAFNGGGYD